MRWDELHNFVYCHMKPFSAIVFVCFTLVFASCKKETEQVVFSNNEIPEYEQVPRILIENYVNRIFIDLIGREPTDIEMQLEADALRAANASIDSRNGIVQKLMFNTDPREGDGSYREAYIRKFYNDQKGRFLEGVSDDALNDEYWVWRSLAVGDSLEGNMLGYSLFMQEANKIMQVMTSRAELQENEIAFEEMCRRMMFNSIYDDINMNTFNFINATFDDCFGRFPTEAEYNGVEDAIEFNGSGALFGMAVNSKLQFLDVLVGSNEFDEGLVRWTYNSLLAREASSEEVFSAVSIYRNNSNFSAVQQFILISDEYAGF